MSSPSITALQRIRLRVTNWSPTDAQIVASLNAVDMANPIPRGNLPVRLTSTRLMQLLSPAGLERIRDYPHLPRILDAINAQNRTQLAEWAALLAIGSEPILPPADVQAVQGILVATEPDPDWQALVSWSSINLGRLADVEDVARAREGA